VADASLVDCCDIAILAIMAAGFAKNGNLAVTGLLFWGY
jgi:hypothetical protein